MKASAFLFLSILLTTITSCKKGDVTSNIPLSEEVFAGKRGGGTSNGIASPSNLQGSFVSSNSISLSWKDNSTNEMGFIVEKKSIKNNYAIVVSLPANSTSFLDVDVSENTKYTYRIKAYNASSSSYSNVVNISFVDIWTGLVAYYPFNGNAFDSSGYGNHGTVNGATLTADRFGILNNAYYFNGSSSITATNNNQISNNITNELTITLWANLNSYFNGITSDFSPLISKNGPYWHQFELFIYTSGIGFWGPNIYQGIASPIGLNTWYFIAITFNNGNIKYYLNGSYIGANTDPVTSLQPSNDSVLEMGMDMANLVEYLDGSLDDIRIYNRSLTQEQITYLATH